MLGIGPEADWHVRSGVREIAALRSGGVSVEGAAPSGGTSEIWPLPPICTRRCINPQLRRDQVRGLAMAAQKQDQDGAARRLPARIRLASRQSQ